MKQRGRKSTASKSVSKLAVIDGNRGSRPSPPGDLSEYEAAKWAQVAGAMPGDWYSDEMHDLLRAYCRTSKIVFEIGQLEDQLQSDLLGEIDVDNINIKMKIIAQRDKQVRQLVLLARSLRLTPQARSHPTTAARAHRRGQESAGAQPWHG